MENYEGFWREKKFIKSKLPWPKHNIKPWKGKTEFIKKLNKIERKAIRTYYKGYSDCRICKIRNGSSDFKITRNNQTWIWPAGYIHYIEKHNIQPSENFYNWVINT